jgi:hypothetical protein
MMYADLLITGANVVTLSDISDTPKRATAFAVRNGRFVFVGSDDEARTFAGPNTQALALSGQTVTPGFCDAHLHLHWYGEQLLRQADLVGVSTVDELLSRLSQHARQHDGSGGWIRGHGFDQEKLPNGKFPTRHDLDRVSTTRPIVVSRICGHAAVVNSAALALVSEPERQAGDVKTGLYTEGDIAAFYRRIPRLTETEAEEGVLRACYVALQTGITSVGTLLDTPEQMGAYARLHRKGKLPLRVTGMPPYAAASALHAHGIGTGFGDSFVRFGGAKFFSDGSLGARTALLAQPYADEDSPNVGIRIYEPEDLQAKARDAQNKGFQIVIHAIGDQAVRESLDAIEYALDNDAERRPNTYHRHRIEHASVLPPDLLARMANRQILAVVQPQFVTSDIWSGERVGPTRAPHVYPFRAMLDAGIPLALSSDCPVEKLDAFACLAAVVGRHAWSPEGGLTGEEALRAYCAGSAYALHAEHERGTIAPGKQADFAVLSGDPARLSAEQIRGLKAQRVFVGGVEVTPSS